MLGRNEKQGSSNISKLCLASQHDHITMITGKDVRGADC